MNWTISFGFATIALTCLGGAFGVIRYLDVLEANKDLDGKWRIRALAWGVSIGLVGLALCSFLASAIFLGASIHGDLP